MLRKPHAAELGLVLLISVLFILLSGCGVSSNVNAAAQKNDIQSGQEREMVLLFNSLLQMDRQPSLIITEKQAASMLSLVKQSAKDGGMNTETEKNILVSLSVDQKNYLNDRTSRKNPFTDEINVEQQMIDLLESKTSH